MTTAASRRTVSDSLYGIERFFNIGELLMLMESVLNIKVRNVHTIADRKVFHTDLLKSKHAYIVPQSKNTVITASAITVSGILYHYSSSSFKTLMNAS